MDEKTREEMKTTCQKALENNDLISLYDVKTVPDTERGNDHFFVITPAHVAYASDHRGGRLSEDCIEQSGEPCGMPGCKKPPSKHYTATVAFLQLKRNVTQTEMKTEMKQFAYVLEKLKIDGVCFVETPEKFRVT